MQSVYYSKSMTQCNGNICKTVSMNCTDGVCRIMSNNANSKKPSIKNKSLTKNNVHIVSLKGCKWCTKLKKLLKKENIPFTVHKTVPQVFVKGVHMGGYNNIRKMI